MVVRALLLPPVVTTALAFAWFGASCGTSAPEGHPDVARAPNFVRPAAPPPSAFVLGAQLAVPIDSVKSAPDAVALPPSPPLAFPAKLGTFFEALSRLDEKVATSDVRIVQFGDSHTAADLETGTARRALQARFGDGGRGFAPIGKPFKVFIEDGIAGGMTREFAGEHGKYEKGSFVGDGLYGIAGLSVVTSRGGARAWTEVASPFSRFEVAYLDQPKGGSFEVFVDGQRKGRVGTRTKLSGGPSSAWKAFEVQEGVHKVEVKAAGDGPIRVFGADYDRDDLGIVLDEYGQNGARATGLLHLDEGHFTEQLTHRAPDLVILAYGTNESCDDAPAAAYERQLVEVLGRVARAAPSASCLLLGPPDRAIDTPQGWTTSAKLIEVIASQRRVAEAAGCAFFDQLSVMGGPGTIAAWAEEEPARGQKDHVHLTREGYAQLGSAFASELVHAYVAWRGDTGRPPPPAKSPNQKRSPSTSPPATPTSPPVPITPSPTSVPTSASPSASPSAAPDPLISADPE